jgi:hypothetical protein
MLVESKDKQIQQKLYHSLRRMKMKMNIKPVYIAAITVIVCVALGTYVTTNSIDSAENILVAQLAEQKAIIDQYNKESQEKLDGLKRGQDTLNENDKVLSEQIAAVDAKIDEQGKIIGLMQEDILAFKESIKNLDDTVRANQEFIIGELTGIQKTLVALRNAGHGKVTAQQVIRYNTCTTNETNCNWILTGN